MRIVLVGWFLICQYTVAATKSECLEGNFGSCKEVFNAYGSSSDKTGAIDFFTQACASQNLKITCEIISSERSDTLKRTLESGSINSAVFVINGPKVDKIYRVLAQFERLQTKQAKPMHFSPSEVQRMNQGQAESFNRAYENSSPEAKSALDEAAKELSSKPE